MSDRPLRILHLTAGSDAGGLSRYIYDLSTALHAQGHHVAVAGERGAWHFLFENTPWPWIDVPLKGGPLALWRSVKILRDYLAAHPIDILHTHYRRATLVARRLQTRDQGSGVRGQLNPPILYTLHLSHISLKWPRRYFTDFGDHTHVASADAQQWLINGARLLPDQITLIPHGIQAAQFPLATPVDRLSARTALHLSPDDLIAAYVGRLDDPKNEAWLLDLALAAQSKLPQLKILLAGEGPHETALRQRIAKEGLQNRVLLLGHQNPLPIYQAADALLLPSAREGFSLVTAEAMSVGLPVLRTRTSGSTELILENITGRSTPIDRDAFIAAALDFLSDEDRLRQMGQAAAAHIRQHFTFDRQVEQTLQLYRTLANRAPRKEHSHV